MHSFRHFRLALMTTLIAIAPACSTTPMDRSETANWYAKYHSMVRWVGYQGSDQQYHHFVARVIDDWAFIKIQKTELMVADERTYRGLPDSPLYYYLVDPNHDYRKIER